jgi:hypothetical protein
LGEIGINPSVSIFIGVSQCGSGYFTSDTQVIELIGHCTQTGFNISQTLSVGELSKRHTEKLIQTRERFDIVIATIPFYTIAKMVHGQKVHQLGKYHFS